MILNSQVLLSFKVCEQRLFFHIVISSMKTKQAWRRCAAGDAAALGPDARGRALPRGQAAASALFAPAAALACVPHRRPIQHRPDPWVPGVHTSEGSPRPAGCDAGPGTLSAPGSRAPPCALGATVPSPRGPAVSPSRPVARLLRPPPRPTAEPAPLGAERGARLRHGACTRTGCWCPRRQPRGLWALLAGGLVGSRDSQPLRLPVIWRGRFGTAGSHAGDRARLLMATQPRPCRSTAP